MPLKIKNKILKPNKGVTLVELLVTLAIIGILIVLAFSINSFAQKVYTKGERLSDVQFNMRMASDFITKEARFASGVETLKATDTIPATIANDDSYIFTEAVGSEIALKYKDKNGERTIATATTLNILFETSSPYKTLYFKLTGNKKGEDFELASEVLVLNLPIDNTIIDSTGADNGVKLKCTKATGGPLVAGLNFNPSPQDGKIGIFYTCNFIAGGGTGPYYFAVTEGALPVGLALDINGTLSGTPTAAGSYMFKVTLTDSSTPAKKVSRYFEVIIIDPSNPSSVPIASNLVVSGTPSVGKVLTANYNYFDLNGDEEENSQIRWYSTDTVSGGSRTLISTATLTYTIAAADLNKYILFEVTPRSINGETGVSVFSYPTSKVSSNLSPVAKEVCITGVTKVGSVLTGGYSYSDSEGDTEGTTQLKWYRSDKKNGAKLDMVEISGANSLNYTLKLADLDKYIFFEVTPFAASGSLQGEVVVSANVGKISN